VPRSSLSAAKIVFELYPFPAKISSAEVLEKEKPLPCKKSRGSVVKGD
jgi:hypothetical protein